MLLTLWLLNYSKEWADRAAIPDTLLSWVGYILFTGGISAVLGFSAWYLTEWLPWWLRLTVAVGIGSVAYLQLLKAAQCWAC